MTRRELLSSVAFGMCLPAFAKACGKSLDQDRYLEGTYFTPLRLNDLRGDVDDWLLLSVGAVLLLSAPEAGLALAFCEAAGETSAALTLASNTLGLVVGGGTTVVSTSVHLLATNDEQLRVADTALKYVEPWNVGLGLVGWELGGDKGQQLALSLADLGRLLVEGKESSDYLRGSALADKVSLGLDDLSEQFAGSFEPVEPFSLSQQDFDQYGFQTDIPNMDNHNWDLPDQSQNQDWENV